MRNSVFPAGAAAIAFWMVVGLAVTTGCEAGSHTNNTAGSGGFYTDGYAGVGGGGSGGAGFGGSYVPAGAGTAGTGGGGTSGANAGGVGGVMDAGGGDGGFGDGGVMVAGAGGGPGDGGGMDGGGTDSGGGPPDTGGGGSGGSTQDGQKFVGNITTDYQVRSDFITYWDQITPENEGKWGSVEGVRDQMNWTPLDAVYNYAKQNGIPFKEHTLVWGSQQPGWLSGLDAAQQRAEVEEWIRLFCERYPDVDLIDVVNEPPPHTTPVYLEALGGAGSSGWDWIVQAFQWTRQYCPNAILILNDYNIIEYPNDNAHFIDIVNAIKTAGAPIDAIGAQAHDAYKLSNVVVQGYLDNLATSTGLPIYVSEYDINIADENQQLQVMQNQFPMFWNHADVKGITLWGYIVGATWKDNTGLMTAGGTQRAAMAWLMDFLGR